MQAPFENGASVNPFWNELSKAIGFCLSRVDSDSIHIKKCPPELSNSLPFVNTDEDSMRLQAKDIPFDTFCESLSNVRNLATLDDNFPWLLRVATDDQVNMTLGEAIKSSQNLGNAIIKMYWPCLEGWVVLSLKPCEEIRSLPLLEKNLLELVEPHFWQYANARASELERPGNEVADNNGQIAAVKVAEPHPPVHQSSVDQPAIPQDALPDNLAKPPVQNPCTTIEPATSKELQKLDSLVTYTHSNPSGNPTTEENEPTRQRTIPTQELNELDHLVVEYLLDKSEAAESALANGLKTTECQEVSSRRLEEGEGGAVVLLDGRVVQGAFNWRTKRGARGEELRCFDYFLNMVKVRPQEFPAAPIANANVRESFVEHRHSDRLIREVTAEVVTVGAFLTAGCSPACCGAE
eukprot:GHVT01060004.1.p1 GENE.GHVT01060004.1~~GHVT01060004.1.p1  ORF type:complete len:408 (+),score=35.18 GHVT01060004.1:966-2189(+)